MMDFIIHGLVVAGLLVLSGFFSSSETALFSLTRIERRRLEKKYPWIARWVGEHLDHPRQALVTILIGNLLVNILATAIVTLVALKYWGPGGTGIAVAVFTLLLILFGEIVPKTIAVRHNVSFAVWTSIPLRIFSILIFPLRYVTQLVAGWVLFFLPAKKKISPDQISEEELHAMVQISEEDGVLDSQERYMIQKLFRLGERPVKEIMTPRIDLAALDVEDSRAHHIEIIRKYHFSHFPVYQNSVDNVLGVISVQEYMLGPENSLQSILLQPLFVPETKLIDDLLSEFKAKQENFAVCVDEYGGTAGIVTLEDILEEIFGDFYDEYARVENPIKALGRREYLVDAKISLADFNEYFAVRLESEDATTLGGFILEKLGEVPVRGKILTLPECDFQVHEVLRRRRIHRVVVKVKS